MNFNPEKGKPNKETKEERKGFVKRAVSLLQETVSFSSYFMKREKLIIYIKMGDLARFKDLLKSLKWEERNKIKNDKRFQKKLKFEIERSVEVGVSILQEYFDLATEETLQWLKTDAFQEKLKIGIGKCVENLQYIPQYYFDLLATEETLQWLKTDAFQDKLKIGIGKRVENGWDIPKQYLDLATEETFQWFKTDTFQEKLKIGLGVYVGNGSGIPKQYFDLATEETLQWLKTDAFQDGLKIRIGIWLGNKKYISQQYLNLANEKTLQEAFKLGNKQRIESGYSLKDSLPLMNEETKESFLTELTTEAKRELTTDLITSFFHNSEKVRRTVEHLIKEKTNEEIEQILFDKTELAMGIKLHTEKGSPYGDFLNSTGGFHAHGQDTTWVANPLPNQKATELAFEVLEKLKEESGYEGDYGYIQTTFPKRLDNKYASIATIVHMFTKDYFETKEGIDQLITHNQDTKGITIYDAGRVITDKYTVPNEKGEASVPSWEGRTDVLLSDTLNDVKNIRTVMTLLVHASEDKLAFSSLGKEFIQEVKDILKTSSHIDLDKVTENITFVGDGVNPHTLGPFLSQIAEMREEMREKYKKYTEAAEYLSSLQEDDSDYSIVKGETEKLYHEVTTHPEYALRGLIAKYREKMFSKGYFHELHGWKDEHEREKLKKVVGEQVERIQEDGIILN